MTLRRPTPAIGRFPGQPWSFVVMNRTAAETELLDEPHLLISVHSPRGVPAGHPKTPARVARLYVECDDVGYELLEAPEQDFQWDDGRPPVFFDTPQARSIRDFVEQHRDAARVIACHCEAGMSRSPAVAAALSRWLNGDDGIVDAITRWIALERLELDEEIVFWNRLVHDRLLAVLRNDTDH